MRIAKRRVVPNLLINFTIGVWGYAIFVISRDISRDVIGSKRYFLLQKPNYINDIKEWFSAIRNLQRGEMTYRICRA